MATNLLWLCQVDLEAGTLSRLTLVILLTDKFALMTRKASLGMIPRACQFREKWRYLPPPESLKEINQGNDSCQKTLYNFGNLLLLEVCGPVEP